MGTASPKSLDQGKRRIGRSPQSRACIVFACVWPSGVFCKKHSQVALIFEEIKLRNGFEEEKVRKACYQSA
jgi:hypothetical protein